MTVVGLALVAVALWFTTVPWIGLGPPGFEYSTVLNNMLLGHSHFDASSLSTYRDKPYRVMCLLYDDPSCEPLKMEPKPSDTVLDSNTDLEVADNSSNSGNDYWTSWTQSVLSFFIFTASDNSSYWTSWTGIFPNICAYISCPQIKGWIYSVMSFVPDVYSFVFDGGIFQKIVSLPYDLGIVKMVNGWYNDFNDNLLYYYNYYLHCCYTLIFHYLLPIIFILLIVSSYLHWRNQRAFAVGTVELIEPDAPDVQNNLMFEIEDVAEEVNAALPVTWQIDDVDNVDSSISSASRDNLTHVSSIHQVEENAKVVRVEPHDKASMTKKSVARKSSDSVFEDATSGSSMTSSATDVKLLSESNKGESSYHSSDSGVVIQMRNKENESETISNRRHVHASHVGGTSMIYSQSDDSVSRMTDYTVSTDADSVSDWQATYYHADCPYCESGTRTPVPYDDDSTVDPIDYPRRTPEVLSDTSSDQFIISDRDSSYRSPQLHSRSWSDSRNITPSKEHVFGQHVGPPRTQSSLHDDITYRESDEEEYNIFDNQSCASVASSVGLLDTPFVQSLAKEDSTIHLHDCSDTIITSTFVDRLSWLFPSFNVPQLFRRSRNYTRSLFPRNERYLVGFSDSLDEVVNTETNNTTLTLEELNRILRPYGDASWLELITAWFMIHMFDSLRPYFILTQRGQSHMSFVDQARGVFG